MNGKNKKNGFFSTRFLSTLLSGLFIHSMMIQTATATELSGVYHGSYNITMWGCPGVCSEQSATILGKGIKPVNWVWDFDRGEVDIQGTMLSVGFPYEVQDIGNASSEHNIARFTQIANGIYRIDHGFQIFNPNVGNPRADTSTTVSITGNPAGTLTIKTIDNEDSGSGDGIPGSQISGVFPMTVQPQMDGWAVSENNNDTGLSAQKKIALGLHPDKTDTDGDSIPDAEELGIHWQDSPLDSDSDSIIDALEPGESAMNDQIAGGIGLLNLIPGFAATEGTPSGQSVTIIVKDNWRFNNVRTALMIDESPSDSNSQQMKDVTLGVPGLDYRYGLISIGLTTRNEALGHTGNVQLTLRFEEKLSAEDKLLVYAQSDRSIADSFTLIPNANWKRIDDYSLRLSVPQDSEWNLLPLSNHDFSITVAVAINTLGGFSNSAGALDLYLVIFLLSILLLVPIRK